jgi:hypothetical protein
MKTAVEWYAEQEVKLTLDFLAEKISELEYGLLRLELLNKAKEMEKEQMKDAYEKGKKYKKPIKDSNPIWLNSKPYK